MDCYQPCGGFGYPYAYGGYGCASPCATPFAASAFAFPYAYGAYGGLGRRSLWGVAGPCGAFGGVGCGRIC